MRIKQLTSNKPLLVSLLLVPVLAILFFVAGAFRTVFIAIYLLPNFYLYHHMKKAFRRGRQRVVFTLVFLGIVLLFPLSMFGDESAGGLAYYARMAGYYYLPLLLYSFLLYIIFDLLILFNRVRPFISRQTARSRPKRMVVFLSVLTVSGMFIAAGIYNFNHTRVNAYQVEVPARSSHLDELKIAMAADVHLSNITRKSFVEQFVNTMNDTGADVILLVGDILESNEPTPRMEFFQESFSRLQATYGVYAVEGNHEHYGGNSGYDFFSRAGIQLLRDTVVQVDDAFYLAGRKDRHVRSRLQVEALLEQASDTLPLIVMDHQPYTLEKTAAHDIDLHFSGHTHHGQLWPLNYITQAIYRISWGHEAIRNTHFFVTCGAQGWGPPVKTSSFSEIMLVEVDFEEL